MKKNMYYFAVVLLLGIAIPTQAQVSARQGRNISAIDAPYLKGFTELKLSTSENYDANSSANQLNRFLGLNQQGTSTTRVSMFANKYPWEKARNLFGAVKGYGAQTPEKK